MCDLFWPVRGEWKPTEGDTWRRQFVQFFLMFFAWNCGLHLSASPSVELAHGGVEMDRGGVLDIVEQLNNRRWSPSYPGVRWDNRFS